jgi:CRISPR-associated protein Cas2
VALNFVVAYDVSDNNQRSRVSERLGRYGVRIQKSVFQCVLTSEDLETLMAELTELVDVSRDTIHAFPTCRGCSEQVVRIGQVKDTLEVAYWIV